MTDLGIPGVGDATLIASGGSALVYEALSGTGERLAVKVLRGIRGAEVTRRFEREQSAAERLAGHPNIIQIHHSGVTGAGEPYLVMPLLARGSLNDELEQSGPFSLQQASGDVAVAADALEFAHGRGVLHRDMKPGNLLRSDDGSIIVTDFGIARVIDAGITSATVGATTPLYAAPEILAENAASVRSEVYALGALLYALLAGQAAFSDTDNIWATMNRIRTEPPPALAGVPAPVMRVIYQAMEKDPLDRPASAALFRENLRTALTSPDDWWPPLATAELPRDSIRVTPPAAAPTTALHQTPLDQTPLDQAPLDQTQRLAPQQNEAPPVPAFDRPAPVVGHAPRRDSSGSKILAVIGVIAIIAGLMALVGWRLLDRDDVADSAIAPPVDNSLPSPDDTGTSDSDQNDDAVDDGDESGVTIDDLPTSDDISDTFVSFTGDHFSALLPVGWSLSASDVQESYGFRSMFVFNDMYMNIDTTPKEQREPGGDIAQSARDIAASIGSASEVRSEEVDGLTMHSFTFRNAQGVDSIDIFFEVDGDGYAVVAGSPSAADAAFATARLVALSVRSNPDT